MTVPSLRKSNNQQIDFGFLRGYNPEKPTMIASDIDMMIERRGYFLVGEWKHINEQVSLGQLRMLIALAKSPSFTVLVVRYSGTPMFPQVASVERLNSAGEYISLPINGNEEFKQYVAQWLINVNKKTERR